MRGLFLLVALFSGVLAQDNLFVEDTASGAEESEKKAKELIDLQAIQKSFFNKNRTGNENTLNIKFEHGKTYNIRTRYAMATTIIIDNDSIISAILGDEEGFQKVVFDKDKFDLSNFIIIKPILIGIDTSLTIIGESGNIYTLYLFSTDFLNSRNPHLTVFISQDREIGKLNIRNLEEEKIQEEKKRVLEEEEKKRRERELESDYLNIGDPVNSLKVKISEIERGYKQKGEPALHALEIFNDSKWTYFRYNKERADSKFPAVYRVVDGYDNPVNVRVVGDFIIAETIADKFTLRIGDKYVCVRRTQ